MPEFREGKIMKNPPNGLEYGFVKLVEWNKFILQVVLLNNLYGK